jgi:hypothetical protein
MANGDYQTLKKIKNKKDLHREEFGLTWNAALETGGVLVVKDIKIKVELEVNPAA